MARNHGRILTTIWTDTQFLAVSPAAQRMYLFLLSQPRLTHAGLLDITLSRWASKAPGLTEVSVAAALDELAEARFVVLDADSEELLIRTLVKNDGVWKQPKVMIRMGEDAAEINSPALRWALLKELERLPLDELKGETRAVVAGVIDRIRAAFGPLPNPDPERVSGRVSPRVPGTPAGGYSEVAHASESRTLAVRSASAPENLANVQVDTPSEGYRQGFQEGLPIPSAGVRAAPAPTPTPSVPSERAAEPPQPATAQTLVAEWIDRCVKRPPSNVIGQTSKQIKQLLDEGIDPDDIRRGLAEWMTKGLHPSTLPSVVNQTMNHRPVLRAVGASGDTRDFRQRATDDQFARAMERARAREAGAS
ncbi:hypothetical protein [Allonocardiopsis opalescens]|uniref:Uncharacterized protein n=1 Tax=Allonocardiopsis opalescens TaxID=1144618 RepID=A0A2T0PP56_9ACTN|nr:hypothetical protein [Allonocardiopsis opalescens]PRX90674.1 hypothetical protein CLV72_11812 [Allonocardiopsis opalescens]